MQGRLILRREKWKNMENVADVTEYSAGIHPNLIQSLESMMQTVKFPSETRKRKGLSGGDYGKAL